MDADLIKVIREQVRAMNPKAEILEVSAIGEIDTRIWGKVDEGIKA